MVFVPLVVLVDLNLGIGDFDRPSLLAALHILLLVLHLLLVGFPRENELVLFN